MGVLDDVYDGACCSIAHGNQDQLVIVNQLADCCNRNVELAHLSLYAYVAPVVIITTASENTQYTRLPRPTRPEHHDACEEDNDGSGNDNDEHACHVTAGRQPDQRVHFTPDFTLEHRRTYSDSAPSVWY